MLSAIESASDKSGFVVDHIDIYQGQCQQIMGRTKCDGLGRSIVPTELNF